MICSGVLKSGSPTPKDTTDSPASFIAFAFAEIANVKDGAIAEILVAILFFITYSKLKNLFTTPFYSIFKNKATLNAHFSKNN